MNGVKEMALAPIDVEPAAEVTMFERLAKDATVPVEKLEKLIELQERIMRHNAKSAFDGTFAKMQAELPEIDERGQIMVRGQLRSTYAKLEDIHAAIKPILKLYGFAIRHRTEWPADKPGIIRIVGILSHELGHSEESCFEAPADKSDFRTDIQSMGSTVSYGRRYTTLDLLNITTRGVDNDGQKKQAEIPPPPDGFAAWWKRIADALPQGVAAYRDAFKAGDKAFTDYVYANLVNEHEARKILAQQKKGLPHENS